MHVVMYCVELIYVLSLLEKGAEVAHVKTTTVEHGIFYSMVTSTIHLCPQKITHPVENLWKY